MPSPVEQNAIFLSLVKEIQSSASTGKISEVLSDLIPTNSGPDIFEDLRSKNESSWDFRSALYIVRVVQENRQSVNQAYEEAMSRYSKVNTITAKRKANEEEVRLKQTLTDYILKIESTFERNDRCDEAMFKEISKFLDGLESVEKLNESNITSLFLSPKAVALVTPILEKYEECYKEYGKLKPILGRLIRIADYIIEDAGAVG
ncbi:hypothetical protein ACE5IS_13595 [Leptospira wolffii]|uniref:Uncharacterized protein n=1 Tax=Leptospira wolffii TaxID=409998 RepID=A0ABV5BQ67_9LEPT|nr:hypothetical protein [Leptospira wolffii]TGL53931.1 hypothetical protein EHQ61_04625 [Leptospira wolffii]